MCSMWVIGTVVLGVTPGLYRGSGCPGPPSQERDSLRQSSFLVY